MAGIEEEYAMEDGSVEKVKSSAKMRKGRGFGDKDRDYEKLQYESIDSSEGPGPMRLITNLIDYI